jgi:hypothetical protein
MAACLAAEDWNRCRAWVERHPQLADLKPAAAAMSEIPIVPVAANARVRARIFRPPPGVGASSVSRLKTEEPENPLFGFESHENPGRILAHVYAAFAALNARNAEGVLSEVSACLKLCQSEEPLRFAFGTLLLLVGDSDGLKNILDHSVWGPSHLKSQSPAASGAGAPRHTGRRPAAEM